MLSVLLIAHSVDLGKVALPVELDTGIELIEGDAEMIAALRKPLRILERQVDAAARNWHPQGSPLDRRIEARPFDSDVDLSEVWELMGSPDVGHDQAGDLDLVDCDEISELLGGRLVGQKGVIEYGQDGRDHYLIGHDAARPHALVRLAIPDDETTWTVVLAFALLERPLTLPLGITQDSSASSRTGRGHWLTGRFGSDVEELRLAWATSALAHPIVIDDDWVTEIRTMLQAVRPIVRGDWPDIRQAFQRRNELQGVPRTSRLRQLGYFIVIEALLTHAPAAGDPADSLGRQLQLKLPLLSNRMTHPIPFDELSSAPPTTLIKKLYEYRSAIAHGTEPDFNKNLRVLGSPERVGNFLDVTTRRLLRHAALEPRLVADLKGPARQ